MTGYIEVKLVSDDDGHEYLIPAELEEKFNWLLGNTSERGTEEMVFDAEEAFEIEFSHYRLGGALDVPLYAKSDYVDKL